jgi:hypothetical protein
MFATRPAKRWHRVPVVPLLSVLPLLLHACGGEPAQEAETVPTGPPVVIEVADVGFNVPESVLHDRVADVYLVSNINGGAQDADGNGFVSRVAPGGEVLELKWIDGETEGVTLDGPKGMAIVGDLLYVADITCIRLFHRVSGDPAGEMCWDDVTFLNDVDADADGSLYTTDTGLNTGSDAVYRVSPEGDRSVVIASAELGGPNGVVVDDRGVFVVTCESGEIFRVTPEGERVDLAPPSEMELDGLVSLDDRGFLFSSWGDAAVYWVDSEGHLSTLLEGIPSPADIGYDADRNRVLVPVSRENRLVIREVR